MTALDRALYDALTAAVAGHACAGVYAHPAPQGVRLTAPDGSPLPVVTYQLQAEAPPVRTLGGPGTAGRVAWRSHLYTIRAIQEGDSSAAADDLLEAVREALDGADLPVAGGRTVTCRWEGGLAFAETADGVSYRHRIGTVRIDVSPSV